MLVNQSVGQRVGIAAHPCRTHTSPCVAFETVEGSVRVGFQELVLGLADSRNHRIARAAHVGRLNLAAEVVDGRIGPYDAFGIRSQARTPAGSRSRNDRAESPSFAAVVEASVPSPPCQTCSCHKELHFPDVGYEVGSGSRTGRGKGCQSQRRHLAYVVQPMAPTPEACLTQFRHAEAEDIVAVPGRSPD